MSRAILLPSGVNLIDEIAKHIDVGSANLSDHLVIFPGKRPAHFLRKKLGDMISGSYFPPHILSIDSFIEWIYREHLQKNARAIKEIDAAAILYELYLKKQEEFGGNHFNLLEDFLPIGFSIFSEIEELRLALVSYRRVHDVLNNSLPFKDAEAVGYFYEHFYEEIAVRNFVTRASMYAEVSEHLDAEAIGRYRAIIVAGFSAMTEAERVIFDKISDHKESIFFFQEGRYVGKHIEKMKLNPERKGTGGPAPAISFTSAPDGHGEVFALSAEIAQLIRNNSSPDENTVVVLPDTDNLFPVINEALSLLPQSDYNISLAYPVVRTPIFAFLNSIMDAVSSMNKGQFYFPDYLKLVLHPYTKNIRFGSRTDVTRILFHTIEEEFSQNISNAFFTLESIEESDIFESVIVQLTAAGIEAEEEDLRLHLKTIHNSIIRPFVESENVGSFANKCINVLNYIRDNSTASLHVYFGRFIEVITASLQELSASLMKETPLSEVSGYCNFIRRYLGFERVPFEGTPLHGLQVLGFLETRNLNFDNVFILDCNDDVLPGAKGTDVLLPQKARELLGLPTYRDREELTAYYFDVLIRGAKEVHCYFIQNDKKEKSRFVEKLLWEQQQREGKDTVKEYIKNVQYAVSLRNETPAAVAKTPDVLRYLRNFYFSASALDRYLRCQLQFYYSDVLRLREKDTGERDIEGKDIGILVHAVLKQYFASRKGIPLKKENLPWLEMERLVNEEFSQQIGDEPFGMKVLLKQQIKHQLADFLEKYQAPKAGGVEIAVLDVERRVKTQKHSFYFEGFVDRIEKRGSDHFILDYKTGGNDDRLKIRFQKLSEDDRESWNEAIGSLQLPLYMIMYANETGIPAEKIKPAYIMLGRNKLSEDIEIPLVDEDGGGKEQYAMIERIIFKLLQEIVDKDILFAPPNDLKKVCPNCSFAYICGTQWVQGWNPD
jgi:CRISPR/Cas system-associated exonuclease Cas4 (RecB family)